MDLLNPFYAAGKGHAAGKGQVYVAGFTLSSTEIFRKLYGMEGLQALSQKLKDVMKSVSNLWASSKSDDETTAPTTAPNSPKKGRGILSRISFGPGIALGAFNSQSPGSWSNPTDYSRGESLQEARINAKGVCNDEIEGSSSAYFPFLRCSWNKYPFPGKIPRISDYDVCAETAANQKCEVSFVLFWPPARLFELYSQHSRHFA